MVQLAQSVLLWSELLICAPLALEVAELGYCTVGLLEIINGSWVSVYMYRKRLLCLMDLCFNAVKGRRAGDVLQLSNNLRQELMLISAMAPFAVTNLRARPSTSLAAVDASSTHFAHVCATIPAATTLELFRHCISRGGGQNF